MANTKHEFRFKITVIGDGKVGKTSLIKKYTKGSFIQDYTRTIGAQFSKYDKEIEGDNIRLLFWDIAGQDDFGFLRPSFYRESRAAIIVYSLEENDLGKNSYNHIANWHEDIRHFCGDIPVVVFANKLDLVDESSLDHAKVQEMVEDKNFLGHYLTSAKTGKGVIEAFNAIINKLYQKYKELSMSL